MALQVFYFFAGVYGWIFWKKRSAAAFNVSAMPPNAWLYLVPATLAQALLYFFIIRHFRGERALLDAVLTAASLTTTYMMTRKWIENWVAWVLIDATYIYLYAVKEMWLFGALYLIFAVMAFYGWREWRRESEGAYLNPPERPPD